MNDSRFTIILGPDQRQKIDEILQRELMENYTCVLKQDEGSLGVTVLVPRLRSAYLVTAEGNEVGLSYDLVVTPDMHRKFQGMK